MPDRPGNLRDIMALSHGWHRHGCVLLSRSGKIQYWGDALDDPPTFRAQQIRTGGPFAAAQKRDGTWVIWGRKGQSEGDGADLLNEKVRELGPLKDLALPRLHHARYFIGIK